MQTLIKVGSVPLWVAWRVSFGVPLLISICRLDGTDVTARFNPEQLEKIFSYVLSSEDNNV